MTDKKKTKKANADMTAKGLRGMSQDELKDTLLTLKKEQFNLRFQQATSQLEKTARVGVVRKDIARIKTILREKTAAETA